MEALAFTPTALNTRLSFTTSKAIEFVDLTERLGALVRRSGLRLGFVNVQSLHTTAAIVVNEHEPLLLDDFVGFLERLAPRSATYAHDDTLRRRVNLSPEERRNGHAHCQSLLLPCSTCINVVDGTLQLGRWQRLFLVELDGPRIRDVAVSMLGTAR